MRPRSGCWRVAWVAALCNGCSGLGDRLPRPLTHALHDAPTTVRVEVAGDRVVRWSMATDVSRMPARVQRAAESVQPGGRITFSARSFAADGGEFWIVEKEYDGSAGGGQRSVWIGPRGEVLRRGHSIPLDAAPAPVDAAVRRAGSELDRLEFWEAGSTQGYSALFEGSSGGRVVLEMAADGTPSRRVLHHRAEVRAAR